MQSRIYVSTVAYSNYMASRTSIESRFFDAAKIRRGGSPIMTNSNLCYPTRVAASDSRNQLIARWTELKAQVITVYVESDDVSTSRPQPSTSSGDSRSSSSSSRTYPSTLGSPSNLSRCVAAYMVVFTADGRTSKAQGQTITASVERAGSATARPMFRALKDNYDAGNVNLGTLRSFTRDCDRIHGYSFNQ
jgi:hypothetical protein